MPSTRRQSRPSSDEAHRSPKETGRSGTIAAVRRLEARAAPRPTNLLRELEKNAVSSAKVDLSPPPFADSETPRGARARRREPVPRSLDPGFTDEDEDRESWERAGTLLLRAPYRDTAATVPSPEELEARLLAELTESAPPNKSAFDKPGARAHFEPAHAPAVRVSPIIALPPPVPVEGTDEGMPFAVEALALPTDFDAKDELEPEPSDRSRITVPPARRQRSPRRGFRALLVGMMLLGGVGAAGWYRYPALCEQGWQLATTQFTALQRVLEYHWSRGMRALGR
jgi:hypothetical protein